MIIYEQLFKKYGFSPTQQEILRIVGKDKVILEVGSSTGYMTRVFLNNGCTVDVVEQNKEAFSKIPKDTRKRINQSIEDNRINNLLNNDYDFIIMADVLEHLINPELILRKLLKNSSNNTKLVISLPNVASWIMRKQLFFKGDFEYQESGLLDKTHLHFYTVNTLPKILSNNGWQVERLLGTITRFPLEGLINRLPIFRWIFHKAFYKTLVNRYKNIAYYHFLVVASKK